MNISNCLEKNTLYSTNLTLLLTLKVLCKSTIKKKTCLHYDKLRFCFHPKRILLFLIDCKRLITS